MSIELTRHIENYPPAIIDQPENQLAAVALIMRNAGPDPEILFIQRATHEKDPWSGQIAFPGGGKEEQDQDLFGAACRETREEVGLHLSRKMHLGRIDDQQGSQRDRKLSLTISCFVFELSSSQKIRHNREVADTLWVRAAHLADPSNRFQYQSGYRAQPFPAVRLDDRRVLWGLTFRFIENFLDIIPSV